MKKKSLYVAAAAVVVALLGLERCSTASYDKFVESLYQQAQAGRRAEFAKRRASIARLEAAQAETAKAYLARIAAQAAAADARIAAMGWKSNAELRRVRASADEALREKEKAETALGEMTLSRDSLVAAAHAREKEIAAERLALKAESQAAMAARDRELAACEKARLAALSNASRPTWLSIGPGGSIYVADGQARAALALSIQIPVIQIKSPFKRF